MFRSYDQRWKPKTNRSSDLIARFFLIAGLFVPILCICACLCIVLVYDYGIAEDGDSLWSKDSDVIQSTLNQDLAGKSSQDVLQFLDQQGWHDCTVSEEVIVCSKRIHRRVIDSKNLLKSDLTPLIFETYLRLRFYFEEDRLINVEAGGYTISL